MSQESEKKEVITTTLQPIIIEKEVVKGEDHDKKEYHDRLVIRSYSSMILFIPTFIISLAFGITQMLLNRFSNKSIEITTEPTGYMSILGVIFFSLFVMNFVLIAFDFGRARTIIITLLIIVAIAVILLVNAYTGFISSIIENFPDIKFFVSTQFYFGFAILLFFVLIFTWIEAMFDYYIVEGNELLHRKAWGGGIERFPATAMSVVKEFPDIIELALFRAGTLILTPSKTDRPIVLKHVFGINKKVKVMTEILSRMKVDIN